jgi:Ca2+-binding RTX toxin-like protein
MATFFASNDAEFDTALANALAAPGEDTIIAFAGAYTLPHVIDSDVTIQGAKVGIAGNAPGRGVSETVFSGGLEIVADSVIIDGVQISGIVPLQGGFETGLRVSAGGTNAIIRNGFFVGTAGVVQPTLGITAASTDTIVTDNLFTGYDHGVYVVGTSSVNINSNVFNVQGGLFSESTNILVTQNTFFDTIADVFSNPTISNDLSLQILADNIVTTTNPFRDIQILPQLGASVINGTVFDDAFAGDTMFTDFGVNQPYHFTGGLGNDYLGGGPQDDFLDGGLGDDDVFGGDGADIIRLGAGNNSADGDLGTDTIDYSGSPVGLTINLTTGIVLNGLGGTDTLSNIENAIGTGGNDVMIGTAGTNVLMSDGGNDSLFGGLGSDVLVGGAGEDLYFVDTFTDVAVESPAEGGFDWVISTATSFTLLPNIEYLWLVEGSAAVFGNGNDDDNFIYGNQNNNILKGNGGDDLIDGLGGQDVLTGGADGDTFQFRAGQADGDTVTDFDALEGDSVLLFGFEAGSTFVNVDATHWQVDTPTGPDEVITFSNAPAVVPFLFI